MSGTSRPDTQSTLSSHSHSQSADVQTTLLSCSSLFLYSLFYSINYIKMDNSLIQTVQNHPNLRTLNIISLIALVSLNVFMLIAWTSTYGLLLFISAESILFVMNILFYFVSEDQRQLIIKYRIFTVYILAGLIILFSVIGLIQWIVNGITIVFKWGAPVSWILSILWLLAKIMQSVTFTFLVRRASSYVGGG